MPAFGLDNIYEWPYLAKLAYYKTIHRACLVFVIDCFYKNTAKILSHSHSDITFMIKFRYLAGRYTHPPIYINSEPARSMTKNQLDHPHQSYTEYKTKEVNDISFHIAMLVYFRDKV